MFPHCKSYIARRKYFNNRIQTSYKFSRKAFFIFIYINIKLYPQFKELFEEGNMSLVARKPVFMVSSQLRSVKPQTMARGFKF